MGDIETLGLETALADSLGQIEELEEENARLKAEIEGLQKAAALRPAARPPMLQTSTLAPSVIVEIIPPRPRKILTTNTPKPKGPEFIQTHGRPMPDEAAARHRLIESIKEKRRAAAKEAK